MRADQFPTVMPVAGGLEAQTVPADVVGRGGVRDVGEVAGEWVAVGVEPAGWGGAVGVGGSSGPVVEGGGFQAGLIDGGQEQVVVIPGAGGGETDGVGVG